MKQSEPEFKENNKSIKVQIIVTLAFLLVMVTAQSSMAGINPVSWGAGVQQSNTAVATSFSTPPVEGNLLVAIVGNQSSISAPPTPTGWTVAISNSPNTPGQIIYYKFAGASEPTTVTVSGYPSTLSLGIHIYEYSGVDAVNPIQSVTEISGSGTTVSTGSINTTADSSLVLAGFTINVGTSFSGWTNGFVEEWDVPNGGGPSERGTYAGVDLVTGLAGPISTTGTAAATGAWIGHVIVLNPAEFRVDTELDSLDGDTTSISDLLSDKGADGFISLREAIIACNNTAGLDTIKFAIAGSTPHTIQPTSGLPAITDSVVIDGEEGGEDRIIIDGTLAGNVNGLTLSSSGSGLLNLVIQNFNGTSSDGIRISDGTNNNTISNCVSQNNTTDGIRIDWLGADTDLNHTITGCTVSGNGHDGIVLVNADGNSITNNIIESSTRHGMNLVGANNGSGNNLISGNTFHSNGSMGVSIWDNGCSNNVFQMNVFHTNDDEGIRVGSGGNNSKIYHNTFYNNGSDGSGSGVTISSGVTGVIIRNSLFTSNNSYGVSDSDNGASTSIDYSGFYGNSSGTCNYDCITGSQNITSDPQYSSPGPPANFNLTECTSPAINAGLDLGVDQVDMNGSDPGSYNGSAPDIGYLESSCLAGFFVDTDSDVLDGDTTSVSNLISSKGADGFISLREAIIACNNTAGLDTIKFAIGTGTATISVDTVLPDIIESIVIDGTSQPGYTTTPIIELDGSLITEFVNGLTIKGGNSVIKGLVINSFRSQGILIDSLGNNQVSGCFIGTDLSGTVADANWGDGIRIRSDSNMIGGNDTSDRNIISGNFAIGIDLYTSDVFANEIYNNYIGTDTSGTIAIPNGDRGISITGGAYSNAVGAASGRGNLISGNNSSGIVLQSSGTSSNVIQANYIGTNAAGTTSLPNGGDGVSIGSDASSNVIGGALPGNGNLISGNGSQGVEINGPFTSGNNVLGNFIGTNATGTSAIPNSTDGIRLSGTTQLNVIGGTADGARNVISGNDSSGISIIELSTLNTIQGNYIGTDTSGTINIRNSASGVYVNGPKNSIGVLNINNSGNLIAYNWERGIYLTTNGDSSGVYGNEIRNSGYSGILSEADFAIISDNLVRNNSSRQPFDEIQLGINNELYNNTIHGSPNGDGVSINGTDIIIKNNIITGHARYGINIESGTIAAESNNLITNVSTNPANGLGQISTGSVDATSFSLDPLLQIDYTLTECTSPAINTGIDVGVDQPTFIGPFPDLGAFESSCLNILSLTVSNTTFAFGSSILNSWLTPQSSVLTNDGTAAEDFIVQLSQLTDGSNNWTISNTSNGADSIRAQWSTASSSGPWTDISAFASDFTIATAVAVDDSVIFWFRILTPTSTTSFNEYTSTMTVTAQEN